MQRIGAARDADAVPHADILGERRFEPGDGTAQDEVAAPADALNGRVDLRSQLIVLAAEIDEGNHFVNEGL